METGEGKEMAAKEGGVFENGARRDDRVNNEGAARRCEAAAGGDGPTDVSSDRRPQQRFSGMSVRGSATSEK